MRIVVDVNKELPTGTINLVRSGQGHRAVSVLQSVISLAANRVGLIQFRQRLVVSTRLNHELGHHPMKMESV